MGETTSTGHDGADSRLSPVGFALRFVGVVTLYAVLTSGLFLMM